MIFEKKYIINKFKYTIPMIASLILYFISNEINAIRFTSEYPDELKIGLDSFIPLVSEFVIPYISWYPFLLLVFVVLFLEYKGDLFFYYSKVFVVNILLSISIFLVFPTYIERPIIENTDLFSIMVKYLYSIDKPFNCFPSLHVSLGFITIVFAFIYFKSKIIKSLLTIIYILIVMSTVLIKQHYAPDIIGGLIVALISFCAVIYFKKIKVKIKGDKND